MATPATDMSARTAAEKVEAGVGRKAGKQRTSRKPKPVTAPQLGLAAVPTIASFEVKTTVYAILTQKLLNRTFEQIQRDLWMLTVKLSVLGFAKEARAAEELFLQEIQKIELRQSKTLDDYETRLDEASITDMPNYGDGTVFTLQVTTPLSRRFVSAVEQCDLLMQRIDALWLHGVIVSGDANDMRYAARSGLQKLANRIRENANHMRGALKRGDLGDRDDQGGIEVAGEEDSGA